MFKLLYHTRMHPILRNIRRYYFKKIIARLKWRKKMVKNYGVNWKEAYRNSQCSILDMTKAETGCHSPLPLVKYKEVKT